MVRIQQLVDRLQAEAPTFAERGGVHLLTGLRELDQIEDWQFSAYVLRLEDEADPLVGGGQSARQDIRRQFAVVLFVPQPEDGSEEEPLVDALAEVRRALIGWQPTVSASETQPHMMLSYGQAEDVTAAYVRWREVYEITEYVRVNHG